MTSFLRKQMAMGVYSLSNVNQNFGFVGLDWPYTNTPYVRFWVDWTQLAPNRPPNGIYSNPAIDPTPLMQGGTVAQYVLAIDNQISLARSYGLNVVLTFFNTPPWASGQTYQTPNYRLYPPTDLSNGGPWSNYFLFCFVRWSVFNPSNGGAYCDFLEVCNEPNLESFPVSHTVPGRMMVIAQGWQDLFNLVSPILAGPATDDNSTSQTYTGSLLSYLAANGFNFVDPFWAWSHHNYRDILGTNGTVTTTRSQRIRTELKNAAWRGWPFSDASNPYVLLTEGGANFDTLGAGGQVNRMTDSYNLTHNDIAGQGQGLAMFTQYLDITAPTFNTGLRNTALVPRQLYSAWASFPQP